MIYKGVGVNMKQLQRTELNFIIKAKLPQDKHYKQLIKIPCGVLQKHYTQAYKKAQDTMKAFTETGMQCRLITKYLPLKKDNMVEQLKIV